MLLSYNSMQPQALAPSSPPTLASSSVVNLLCPVSFLYHTFWLFPALTLMVRSLVLLCHCTGLMAAVFAMKVVKRHLLCCQVYNNRRCDPGAQDRSTT